MNRIRRLVIFLLLACFLPVSTFGLTLEEERKYGREVYLEMARSSKFYDDPFLVLHLSKIKERLEAATSLPFPVKMTVIESQEPNAFAMIGGYVYITTGLLEFSDREEEVAGVLAHELAHLSRRHVAKRADKDKYLTAGMIAALLAGMILKSPALMTTGMASAQTVALKYSREDETEADRVGLATAERAGYSGRGIAEFLKKMRQMGLEKLVPQYLLTHPYSDERIKNINALSTLRQTTVDVSFYPILVERLRIRHSLFTPSVQDTVLNRYAKDPENAVNAYSAALVFSMQGRTDKALEIIKKMDSPHRALFTAEILIKGQKSEDAIVALEGQPGILERILLARAYEQSGALSKSAEILHSLLPQAKYYPEILHRLGMTLGRQGNQAGGYAYLGRYYYETGREDAARSNLEKAVAKYGVNNPESRELTDLLALMKKQKGHKEKKEETASPFLILNRDWPF